VLRFEDTDKKREVAGSAEHLIASLKAIGIDYEEGPDIGGPYGPYIQSQRLDHYQAWAQKLIEQGRAYADPYTPEEIQAFRDEAQASKRAFRYRDHRPGNPPAWDGSQPLRFKSEPKSYSYHDEVMGDITTSPEVVDDFILIKSDGYPTYNFAHIVDDAEMQITHVIRGQEFISSMPNYLALYEALGFDMSPRSVETPHHEIPAGDDATLRLPVFAHMPHIMNE
jgi:glutamyl-tRNA synthetase